jgi:hypothetical protein
MTGHLLHFFGHPAVLRISLGPHAPTLRCHRPGVGPTRQFPSRAPRARAGPGSRRCYGRLGAIPCGPCLAPRAGPAPRRCRSAPSAPLLAIPESLHASSSRRLFRERRRQVDDAVNHGFATDPKLATVQSL